MDPLGSIASTSYASVAQATSQPATESRPVEQRAETSTTGNVGAGLRLPEDNVTLSGQKPEIVQNQASASEKAAEKAPASAEKTASEATRTEAEDPQVQQQVSRLKQIEEKVKAHEAAHKAVGGSLASSASYSYTQGPDGRNYITGGEVQIDMSGGRTPKETIAKMQQVIRAALAPADPSGQDRAVAAQAATQMAQAQQQKLQSDSPAAEPDPVQPVDPAKEAIRAARSPAAAENKTDSAGPGNDAARVQQAYGNPAVQGTGSSSHPSARRQTGFPADDAASLISSFA